MQTNVKWKCISNIPIVWSDRRVGPAITNDGLGVLTAHVSKYDFHLDNRKLKVGCPT